MNTQQKFIKQSTRNIHFFVNSNENFQQRKSTFLKVFKKINQNCITVHAVSVITLPSNNTPGAAADRGPIVFPFRGHSLDRVLWYENLTAGEPESSPSDGAGPADPDAIA